MKRLSSLALAGLLATVALPALAFDLIIGRSSEPSSIDPQFSRTGNNQMTADMIFGRLASFDENLQMHPNLAVEWTSLDPLSWEIKLRPGVKFHDGSDFTVDDVIFSIERTDEVPNSPAPFTDMVAGVDTMTKADDLTLRITTKTPNPAFMEQIGRVFIVSRAATEGKASTDFDSGTAAIGTGPYRFTGWKPGENLTLAAFDGYWGDQPEFKDVEIRFISNDAARVAALSSGAVDLIDTVPPADVPRLAADPNFTVISEPSGRVIYLGLSMRDDTAPGVTDLAGQPLTANPFRDARVRKAISLMIDRGLIVDRILGGSGVPAGQIAAPGLLGHVPELAADTPDVEQAKALLAEAGYPEGFGITVVSSNDRFPGDGDLAQAIAQMLARGGLKVNKVEALPYNVYSKAATAGEYGAFVFSLGASTPTSATLLQSLLHTYDKEARKGAFNRVRYTNPAFDAALAAAMEEFDPERRVKMLEEATRLVFADTPVVPLYWQKVHWAAKAGLTIKGGLSEDTLPQAVSSVK